MMILLQELLTSIESHYNTLPHSLQWKSKVTHVDAVAWFPDRKSIASGAGDKTVLVWAALTGNRKLVYTGHTDAVNFVVWSPNGKHIASASIGYTVRVWDAVNGRIVLIYTRHSNEVYAVAWLHNGKRIASASSDHTV